jgi:alpha-1,6-mannosyltransferase
MAKWFALRKDVMLYVVRGIVALCTWSGTIFLAQQVDSIQPRSGSWFLAFQCTQFHFIFWGSRTIPNVFALILVQFAIGFFIRAGRHSYEWMTIILVFCASIFRAETAPLAFVLIITKIFIEGKKLISSFAFIGFCAFISVVVTTTVDSYFWGRPIWPEFEVFLFNGIENKSVSWGVHPFHYYFTHLMLKVAPLTFPIAKMAMVYSKARMFTLVGLLHMTVMSFIPHKEWRFVIYCIPLFGVSASIGVSKIIRSIPKVRYVLVLMMSAVLFMQLGMLYISGLNYPGGWALRRFNEMARTSDTSCSVHLDTFTSMTGASRFLEIDTCSYFKTENLDPTEYRKFDFLITHHPQNHTNFEIVDTVNGFTGVRFPLVDFVTALQYGKLKNPIVVKVEPLVFIMKQIVMEEAYR